MTSPPSPSPSPSQPPPSQFYTGIVAELYRHLRSETFDPAPYARLIERYGQPALEMGCGDGDPILDLIEQGYEVEGLDSSADMLARCRVAAADRGLDVNVHEATFESMDLGRRYRSIYFAGATFNLIPTDDGAEAALVRIAAHLEPGGAVLIPLFVPALAEPGGDGWVRESADSDGSLMRMTTLDSVRDEVERTQRTGLRYERLVDGAIVDSGDRSWLIHWHTREAFAEMAARAGLQPIHVFEQSSTDFTFLLTPTT
ncbi:MAG: class I SAM-dependent methyltransferase [Ilumatobacteraceae bacterium]